MDPFPTTNFPAYHMLIPQVPYSHRAFLPTVTRIWLAFVAIGLTNLALHLPVLANESDYRGAAEPTTAEEIYGQGVRETPWLSPAQEQQQFHLPPDFTIELVACEPLIAKPMNMAWDARGRLWVTSSNEYPYPAAAGTVPGDTLRILADEDGDGQFEKSTLFADELNIPIGVLPVADGAICYSIPNIWWLRDRDGDDRVDERVLLYGPFDTTRDTHGMVNSLVRGDDGWIYACHGFNNQSSVTAADGSHVQLNSGNTFRFRDDGSRIEQVTQGQVNPFGVTRDEWGNWYSADCHSKPLTALLPGGCYPSFGRPHDGLGFAPSMMDHLHGSTAICGLLYYQAEQFPAPYRHLFYSGNVMTSRINCDALVRHGATGMAVEQADFLTCDDPWFRPVDIQQGADGAMYVSDFYNRIIGHYEVPLEHPGRDRNSGRIWRIRYTGNEAVAAAQPLAIDHSHWMQELSSNNATRRALAVEAALQEGESSATGPLANAQLSAWLRDPQQVETLRQSCLELLFRRGEFPTASSLLPADTTQQHLLVQQLKLAVELPSQDRTAWGQAVRSALPYENPQAKLAACRLLGAEGLASDLPLLARFVAPGELNPDDEAISHTARIAMRNILRRDDQLSLVTSHWSQTNATFTSLDRTLAEILPAVDTALAAARLLDWIAEHPDEKPELVEAALALATKHADDALLERLLAVTQRTKPNQLLAQAGQFELICKNYLGQHAQLSPTLRSFGQQLQRALADELRTASDSWSWSDASASDWATEQRPLAGQSDTDGMASLRSSLSRGESYTGKLTSESFACPGQLSFWIAGHNGFPNQVDQQQNFIELQEVATGAMLRQAFPPRNDTAQPVQWSLDDVVGGAVRLVVTDGDAAGSYAWLAVGEFSLQGLNPGRAQALLTAYRGLLLRGLEQLDVATLQSLPLSLKQRGELIAAALSGAGQTVASTLAIQALACDRPDLVGTELLQADASFDWLTWASQIAASATSSQQREMTKELLRSTAGCELLQQLLEADLISLQSMRHSGVVLPANLNPAAQESLVQKMEQAAALQTAGPATADRAAGLPWHAADLAEGQKLFQQHCAACHQLRGQGTVIGPQLDGAIVRGPARMCEDILEPNINVDKAFRITALMLDDDTVLTGLVRDIEDGSLVITGQDGKVQTLASQRVADRRDTVQSLMPANFGELLSDQQLASLLKFMVGP